MAFNWAKVFSGKSLLKSKGGVPGALYDYRADETGTSSVARNKEKKAVHALNVEAQSQLQAAQERETAAQAKARQEQADQLAARRRNKRFAYGYNRRSSADTLGDAGSSGGPKTLLGY